MAATVSRPTRQDPVRHISDPQPFSFVPAHQRSPPRRGGPTSIPRGLRPSRLAPPSPIGASLISNVAPEQGETNPAHLRLDAGETLEGGLRGSPDARRGQGPESGQGTFRRLSNWVAAAGTLAALARDPSSVRPSGSHRFRGTSTDPGLRAINGLGTGAATADSTDRGPSGS